MTAGWVNTITPDPDIACRPGWCLEYVRKSYGQPARYGSATEAWEASTSQHRGRDFPAAWVPVHYGVAGVPAGHIVLRAPDGSAYSTTDPVALTPVHHPSLEDLERRYTAAGLPLTYRGWTEDIAGTPVIKRESNFMADLTEQQQADIYWILCTPSGREYLADLVGGRAASKTLNTAVKRAGVMGGETSLAGLVSWNDQHVIDQLAATAAAAASDGATVEQITAALRKTLADSVVKVDVSVGKA